MASEEEEAGEDLGGDGAGEGTRAEEGDGSGGEGVSIQVLWKRR